MIPADPFLSPNKYSNYVYMPMSYMGADTYDHFTLLKKRKQKKEAAKNQASDKGQPPVQQRKTGFGLLGRLRKKKKEKAAPLEMDTKAASAAPVVPTEEQPVNTVLPPPATPENKPVPLSAITPPSSSAPPTPPAPPTDQQADKETKEKESKVNQKTSKKEPPAYMGWVFVGATVLMLMVVVSRAMSADSRPAV